MFIPRKIGVVTATRAEYGLFLPLIKKLSLEQEFELLLFVTGSHLSYEFGFTKNSIVEDGFDICEEIDCLVGNDTASAIGKTAGLALMGLTDAFNRHRPDLIFLLGDRYETLCAAMSATINRIPIAHLYGGEITTGAYDESFRHSITKMSHLHFTAVERYRKRVIQLGEYPDNVFNVGAIGIDNIVDIEPMSKTEIEKCLGIVLLSKVIVVTLHPETLSKNQAAAHAKIMMSVLDKLEDVSIIITGTNADSEGRIINKLFEDFAHKRDNCFFIKSLGQNLFISMLHITNIFIGNSSSGIIEAPTFGLPVINIGTRQEGRIRSKLIIDVPWDPDIILENITKLLRLKKSSNFPINPYGEGNTANKIISILKNVSLDGLLHKQFHDLDNI